MPRRRPECGAARAVGGTGPGGGRIRTGRSRPPRPELQRYRGAGARREAGPPMRETRRRRGPQGAKKAASAPRCTNGPQGRTKVGRTCRRDLRRTGRGCRCHRGARRKAHAAAERPAGQGADAGVAEEPAEKHTQPQRSSQDRVRMPESQRSPQDRARMPKPPRSPPKPRKRPGRPLAPEGRPSPQRAMQNENQIRATAQLPPDFRPTSARLSQGAQEPHREHRTAQTAPPEKIRARGFTASGSSVRLVRLMRVGESHVSIHKDNSGLR